MNKSLPILTALMLTTGAALAAPPTDAQTAQFYAQCMTNSGDNASLCACKRDLLPKLVDEEFMAVVLSAMEGKSLTEAQNKPYGIYISKSNQVCAPGM
ncbi:MAG: hypothetical protein HY834_08430 [Devosia nanyangense]|uniref:Rap1a immunity protein domain-containing protein n=1 Tax=Devosia nanyangense TaxID=1228055 RepID=A0A933L284_9HYPH|nr:hypothetical protein [Devosia nanyangense]